MTPPRRAFRVRYGERSSVLRVTTQADLCECLRREFGLPLSSALRITRLLFRGEKIKSEHVQAYEKRA